MAAGDGNGWVRCTLGHDHWGRYGAAGLLLHDDGRVLLQHRATWSHLGGTWGLLGGARDSHESAAETAVREAYEEGGVPASSVAVTGTFVDDHGGWTYTSVVARAVEPLDVAAHAESIEVRWQPLPVTDELPLHPGFAATWPVLRVALVGLHVVVDAANVIGSQPDGWWRDRAGAASRLLARIAGWTETDLADGVLPPELSRPQLTTWRPAVHVVLEGAARPAVPPPARPRPGGDQSSIHVIRADRDGDDEIVATVGRLLAAFPADRVLVVTADRELRARCVAAGASTIGPRWLLNQL